MSFVQLFSWMLLRFAVLFPPSWSLVHDSSHVQKTIPESITTGAVLYGGGEDHFILIPSLKLALCTIAKNGWTQFEELFYKLTDNHFRWDEIKPFGGNIEKLFNDGSWTKAVFLRDPLARLVSGYKDKCEPPLAGRVWDCMNFEDSTEKSYPSFDRFVSEIYRCHNPHFDPQTSQCFLSTNPGAFNFVGTLSENYPSVSAQVQKMLTSALSRSGHWSDEKKKSLEEAAEFAFPPAGPDNVTFGNSAHFHANTVVSDYFKNSKTLDAALQHYAVDYMNLPLHRPDFVSTERLKKDWHDAIEKGKHADIDKLRECRTPDLLRRPSYKRITDDDLLRARAGIHSSHETRNTSYNVAGHHDHRSAGHQGIGKHSP
eukprot:TRINITY_DN417_c0_g1_i6.p1 TRINITY_DN417_c0_g1~~TRINITY_DN417_c0_g1_i6.p1  ORF type:complete len:371 (-),score=36.76 TRINITY_DN417_c0_g1_i6:129-1241(-)